MLLIKIVLNGLQKYCYFSNCTTLFPLFLLGNCNFYANMPKIHQKSINFALTRHLVGQRLYNYFLHRLDWKEKLGAAFSIEVPTHEQIEAEKAKQEQVYKGDALQQQGKQVAHVVVERKGRAGKVATIIVDLKCDDQALKELASRLKQQLGVGGSARDGEILIQGDHRQRVMQLMSDMGFKVK